MSKTSKPVRTPMHRRILDRLQPFRSVTVWKRIGAIVLALLILLSGSSYAIARWYQGTQKDKPYEVGVTFIPSYAAYLGVNPRETMQAAVDDLGVRQFRLVSYWNEIEQTEGSYDFSSLDWQFREAEQADAKVSLAIGLRQPRWPECHAPSWVDTRKHRSEWQPALERYMTAVIERYRSSPSLISYQLENEFFNKFGDCHNFDRERLADELKLVKATDPYHPVIISRSNNYAGFAIRPPLADINGISLYRRVWDAGITKRYFTYPFPSWHYAFLAGAQKLIANQDSVIHELQTEPWPPNGQGIRDTSLQEHNRSFDASRFVSTVEFAGQTGIRHIDLWGVEYWYYRKQVLKDKSVWDVANRLFFDIEQSKGKQLFIERGITADAE